MTPRGEFVHEAACAFLLEQHICNLPVDPFALIKRARWGLVTYSRLGELSSASGDCFPLLSKSRDGFTIFNGRNYCIAYNDAIDSTARVTFTLMHEIGHIVLGHFMRSEPAGVDIREPELEEEAGLFAALVLAPPCVIRRCSLTTPDLLHAACGLSLDAAGRRLAQQEALSETASDRAVERLFDAYIKANSTRRLNLSAVEIDCEESFRAAQP